MATPVFWDVDLDPGVVILQSAVGPFKKLSNRKFPRINITTSRPSAEGIYGVYGEKSWRMPVLLLDGASPDEPVAFVVPFGPASRGRVTAVARFLSLQRGRMMPDTRVTSQRRQRLRQLLLSFDARRSGASHRDIAAALFGSRRVTGPDWHESALRYFVIRQLKDGAELVRGGYLKILQHRGRA